MTTKNIYAEVIDTYNRLCKNVRDILVVSWNYWIKLKTKIEDIYNTEDESECLTESASKFLENLYSEEDDDGTVLFEKLGFKDVIDEGIYLGDSWTDMQEDFVVTIISYSKNYVKVKLYDLSDDGSTTSLKIPVEYLQSENYEELIKAKYKALDKEIDKITKKKSEKSNKIKEITLPKIELKEKLKEFIGDKPFDSEKEACEVVETFAKEYSTNFKEYYVACHCEKGMIAVVYNEDSCFDPLKVFMLPVTIKR